MLTVERLFADPPLITGAPQQVQFAPDGEHVCYLRPADDDRERLDLWRANLSSGRHECWLDARTLVKGGGQASAAEQAERERRRQFARGITAYQFSPCGRYLLLPVDGAAHVLTLSNMGMRTLTPPETRQTDMRFAADGNSLCYVRGGNLLRCDVDSGQEQALTTDGGGTVSYGLADFIAQEEMHRFEGYWWSADSQWLAFTRVDEGTIPESLRYEMDAERISVIAQRYPYAGAVNAQVSLLALHLATGTRHQIDFREAADDYLARVVWVGRRLVIQRQSRDQQRLDVLAWDPATGEMDALFSETSPTWVNLHDNLVPVGNATEPGVEQFLWTSERDGPSHLYLWRDGTLRPLTRGGGRVERVHWADARRALISGWQTSPTEQHLFEVRLDGQTPPRQLTDQAGWHEAVVNRDGTRAVCRMSSLTQPGALVLVDSDGDATASRSLLAETITDDHPYHPYRSAHVTPTLGTLTAEDGQTLHYRLTPPAGSGGGRAPVVVFVYGGPGAQRVRNEWPALLPQIFSQRGFGVFELDNRGSANRDRRFESVLYRRMGDAEVRDQAVGVEHLRTLPWVDGNRIGIFGHSYGGYMTLMCLMQRPDLFRAGVAVAPVTDWSLYDTHYTERFLGTPADNPDGYRASSVFQHIDGLSGRLLLMHGMADDNVLFTHSTRLIQALQARCRPFELMVYPGAKHALHERHVSVHRFNLMLDFFARNL
ncbi:MAG: alpha/beta fold hydrolase [Pseudomonadales bacterium]